MGKIAFLFAGQGAQYPGMGKELCEASPAAAKVFAAADAVRPGTSRQCFEGTKEELTQTVNTQPTVFAVDLAAAVALQEAGIRPDGVAGFSLGEVAAVTFAGLFGLEAGFELVTARGECMDAAAKAHPGAMVAVLGMEDEEVEALCRQFDEAWPVNYNSGGQVVVATREENAQPLIAKVKEQGKKAMRLAVSGAFHSPYMEDASRRLAEKLAGMQLGRMSLPVYANVTAQPYGEDAAGLLARQVKSPVRWRRTIQQMAEDGYTTFIEVGPGKTLSGLVKKILPDAVILRVQDGETLSAALKALQ